MFNELYARISADEEWLGKIAEEYVDFSFLFSPRATRKHLRLIGILIFGQIS